jgi:putative SOS response-associated peptidase YedK
MGLHLMAPAHKKIPVIIRENGQYKLKEFEWGIITEYMDSPEKVKKMRVSHCNARAEKILEDKRSFWYRIRQNRCLMPIAGMYEHREIKTWKNKVPYHIKQKGRSVFAIPALFHYNTKIPSDVETGEVRGMVSMVTREGNDVMKKIHNGGDNPFRMPMFLPDQEMELSWLKEGKMEQEEFERILGYELPSEKLEYWPVNTIRSSKLRPDGLTKVDPWNWPKLPPLGVDEPLTDDAKGVEQVSLF